MEKYVPYEKLSKKKKKELDASRRRTWGGLSPVTRKPENPKAYNRRKAQKRDDGPDSALSYFLEASRKDRMKKFFLKNFRVSS